jgi:adenylate kinase family enzyme
VVTISARRVLITGMSGTGKSTALAALAKRGFEVVETDVPPWSEWSDEEGGYVWREDVIDELLSRECTTTLYMSGTVSNQGRFYDRLDAIVLLSAPEEVLLARIDSRTDNAYGKASEERQRIIDEIARIEPLLRTTCTHEIDTTKPVADVVADLVAIGSGPPIRRSGGTGGRSGPASPRGAR